MSLFRLLAWFGFVAFLFGVAKVSGASLGDINDPGSLLLCVLGTAVVLALTFSPRDWQVSWGFLRSPQCQCSMAELSRVEAFFRNAARAAWASGAFITLFHLAAWLHDLPSSNPKLAPIIAVACLPLLYALATAEFIFIPLATRARRALLGD